MINIEIAKLGDKIKEISIRGHANSSEYGNDLVCCAVSVLSQSVINSMIKALDFREDFFEIDDSGSIKILIPTDISDVQYVKLQTLADLLDINLKDLSEQYSEYMVFKIKGGLNDDKN